MINLKKKVSGVRKLWNENTVEIQGEGIGLH
jgi:hypothetical protein